MASLSKSSVFFETFQSYRTTLDIPLGRRDIPSEIPVEINRCMSVRALLKAIAVAIDRDNVRRLRIGDRVLACPA